MKICICVSGQLRGDFRALKILRKEVDKIKPFADVYIVFSVWDKVGYKVDGAMGRSQLARIFDREDLRFVPESYLGASFWDRFPKAYQEVSAYEGDYVFSRLEALFPEAILDVEKDALDLHFSFKVKDVNSKKMLYKVWRANEIKLKLEKSVGTFDCVVRMRPDLKISIEKEIVDCLFRDDEIYIPLVKSKKNYTPDFMAYGSSVAMDIYSALFSKAISGRWGFIHSELDDWLMLNDLKQYDSCLIESKGIDRNQTVFPLSLLREDPFMSEVVYFMENASRDEVYTSLCRRIAEETMRDRLEVLEHVRTNFFMNLSDKL